MQSGRKYSLINLDRVHSPIVGRLEKVDPILDPVVVWVPKLGVLLSKEFGNLLA